jgi:uncharacterized protein (UPF0276 family)
VEAVWVSDHLCWTGIAHKNTHDLLPMPYTEESLRHVVRRARQVSDILERPLVLENPSTYCEFTSSTLTEWDFLGALGEQADCGFLLDVNNVYVSSYNHGYDPVEFVKAIPHERVVQYHLAGHTNFGTHILDTHSDHVLDPVWDLYRLTHEISGGRATLLEWDESIPPFEVVHAEALKAQAVIGKNAAGVLPRGARGRSHVRLPPEHPLSQEEADGMDRGRIASQTPSSTLGRVAASRRSKADTHASLAS